MVNEPPSYGDLRIEECRDDDLRHYVRTARLVDPDILISSNPTPELPDVRTMALSPQAFTLSAFERVEGVEFAQHWLLSAHV